MQFNKIGIENTTEIKSPLLSKYCCLEKICQLVDASSFMLSEKYTNNTINDGVSFVWKLTGKNLHKIKNNTAWKFP